MVDKIQGKNNIVYTSCGGKYNMLVVIIKAPLNISSMSISHITGGGKYLIFTVARHKGMKHPSIE